MVSVFLRTGFAVVLFLVSGLIAEAATVPAAFTESLVAGGLANPTSMAFAPDGRLFVAEQGGRLRVIRDGVLLPTPFVTLTVDSRGERGLLGVAFDPDFFANQYVYVYYTATSPTVHNRIGRFTASGDVALAGSGIVIFDLNTLSSDTNHNGGAIHFGGDGKLYAAVGDNGNSANAQTLGNLFGKMLRINKDGTIPADNPFYTSASGSNRAIWALGLRNPFTFSVQPFTGAILINDVGQATWEEINDGVSGANYGWPSTEGYTSDARFHSPGYAYGHTAGACAITGGVFYDPSAGQFPAEYVGDYFFADHCAGWIRKLDLAGNTVEGFATGIAAPVDLKVSAEGALYYLARGGGSTTGVVYRIQYGSSAPAITTHPGSQTVRIGEPVTFSVSASGAPPLSYQWQRNGANIAGAIAASYTISSVTQSDDGGRFRAIVTNDFGSATSNEAVLTVTANQLPTAAITAPGPGALYSAGEVITYAGGGTDPEDGMLPASAFTWQVDFHHDTHIHPFIQPTTGATGGSFTVPTIGETSANVWYRIYLTVHDSGGLTHTTHRDVLPRKARITLASTPSGLQLKLDGQPITTPVSFDGVVGLIRNLEAVSPQTVSGGAWAFGSWSDGGAARHDISTPSSDTTYTATFVAAPAASGLIGHWDMDAASVTGGTLADRSGLGHDGTISGAMLAAGIIGDSLAFDGVNDRVDVAGASALDTAGGFTVAFWYLADVKQGSIIAKPYGTGSLNSWQFEFVSSGAALSFTSSNGSSQHFDTVPAPAAGTWIHVAGSWDGATKRLFINGAPAIAVARSIAMGTLDMVIGGDYNGGSFVLPFKGRVDEVRMYDHALSEPQIQQLYQAAFAPDTDAPSVPTGLAAAAMSSSRIDLSWQPSTDNVAVTGYRIFRQGVAIATATGTNYSDMGLSPATTYSYEIAAYDAAENQSPKSITATATTGAAPVLTSITITPPSAAVPLGGTQQFTAQGQDQSGNPMSVSVSWTVSGGGSMDAAGLFTASTVGGPFTVTAQAGTVSGTAAVTVSDTAPGTIVEAHFDTAADGFVYVDDAFRGTNQPGYASGVHATAEGFTGGAVKVTLGGINDVMIAGMSGGWRHSFTLSAAAPVSLAFRYKLTQTAEYESDELSEVLVRVDALQPGTAGTDYVARIAGDGNGGTARTTGWQIFQVDLGTLAAGAHILTIGGYNNKKTFHDEVTELLIDDVVVTSTSGAAPVLTSITITPASAAVPLGGTQQFTAQGQDQSGNPMSVSVSWTVSGGGSMDAAGLFTASTVGGPFTVTAQAGTVSGTAAVTVSDTAPGTIVEAHFDTAADGFVYVDDVFRGTSQPGYASGVHATAEGFTGGAVKVTLGGINDVMIAGMSGGWRHSFTLSAAAPVSLAFRYKLTQTAEYESDELSEVLVRVDALQPGTAGTDYVARIAGDGNGGTARTTGWQIFQVDLGTLAAGAHILTIGGYNNKKTFHDEVTELLIDDVVVTSTSGAAPVLTSITITPASAAVPLGGTQQFTAQGQDQSGNPMSVSVSWTVSGGGSMDTAGLFTASTVGGPFTVTAQAGTVSGTAAVTVSDTAPGTIVEAHFDTAADGFVYVDDAFRGTSQPGYASGVHATAEGFSGGAVKVTLGGINDSTSVGMSGGWRHSFTLSAAAPVSLAFRYKLTQTAQYESDELSEVLVRVDALQPGTAGTDYVVRIAGDGNGGTARTTGWQIFQVDLGTLAAGAHILTIGGYNNKKTFRDEVTDVLIDDVVVTVR